MRVNLELYRAFYTTATNGSISKAAEALFVSQPAVTFQIKSLEEQLGICLFVRTKHGVVLTDEGQVLFNYVKDGLETFNNGENIITNLKNLDSGLIRIGASTTVSRHVLMSYLGEFHEKYPKVDIQIVNSLTDNLLSLLRNGSLDILILNLPMKESKDFNIIPVMDVQDIFVGNKKYFDLTHGKLKLQELNSYPLLFQKLPSNTRNYLDKYLKSNNVDLIPKMEVVSYNLIMDFVKSGFGIGYATKEFIKEELNNKSLYEIIVSPSVPKRYIGIVIMNQNIPNYSVKKLIDIMTKE